MYLLKSPSILIGWLLIIISIIDSFTTKLIKIEYSNYLIIFWLGVFVAEKWCDKKVEAERFYAAFKVNGEYISEKVKKVIMYKEIYFRFWVIQKILLLLSALIAYMTFHYSGQSQLLNGLFNSFSNNGIGLILTMIWLTSICLLFVVSNNILNKLFKLLIAKDGESLLRYSEYLEFGNLYFDRKQREEERKLLTRKS